MEWRDGAALSEAEFLAAYRVLLRLGEQLLGALREGPDQGGVPHLVLDEVGVGEGGLFAVQGEGVLALGGAKATPTGAVAQFAAAGKEVKQKDLAAIAMSYGWVLALGSQAGIEAEHMPVAGGHRVLNLGLGVHQTALDAVVDAGGVGDDEGGAMIAFHCG